VRVEAAGVVPAVAEAAAGAVEGEEAVAEAAAGAVEGEEAVAEAAVEARFRR
jgi:hypothetical protein